MTGFLIVTLTIATGIPLLAFFLIYKLDFFKTGQNQILLLSFSAGALAFLAASFLTNSLAASNIITLPWEIRQYTTTPLVEEILKALILVYLVRRPKFTYFVEGAIYGFSIGIGFAILENYRNILAAPETSLITALVRVFSTNLMHATTSAIMGIVFGRTRLQNSFSNWAMLMAGLVVATGLHCIFNYLGTVLKVNDVLLLVCAVSFGLIGSRAIAIIIQQGLKEEKGFIETHLGMADRVTHGEAKVVSRMDQLDEILEPFAKRFGEEKAGKARQFLIIQARLGIMRKSLDGLDGNLKRATEEQMRMLQQEMDGARREVGSYEMLYLRNAFPDDTSPLWGQLEASIQERARRGYPPNIWGALSERQQEVKSNNSSVPEKENPEGKNG